MINRRRLLALGVASPFVLSSSRPVWATTPDTFATLGRAIHGTDPVAYFTQSAAIAGNPEMSLMWKGAQWLFASADNRAAFEMNPTAYAPQYGGYCALAMSMGSIAATVPDAWTIYDDRLYLNMSIDVRQIWLRDVPENIARADEHWPTVLAS